MNLPKIYMCMYILTKMSFMGKVLTFETAFNQNVGCNLSSKPKILQLFRFHLDHSEYYFYTVPKRRMSWPLFHYSFFLSVIVPSDYHLLMICN